MRANPLDLAYAERTDPDNGVADELLIRGGAWVSRRFAPLRRQILARFAIAVERQSPRIYSLSDGALREAADTLRGRFVRLGMTRDNMIEAFALTREACSRQIGLRHYHVQLLGGAAMLRRSLAEMQTGEGKTITALLPAAAFALAGRPVHIITVNEYLADRDAGMLRSVYETLGLKVGLVAPGQSPDERRTAYAADITYCTNKDLVFDYLRDRLALGRCRAQARQMVRSLTNNSQGRLLLRGLHVALIDEADSVLIDEARTPLILAGLGEHAEPIQDALYGEALELGRSLERDRHWRLDPRERRIHLTAGGQEELRRLSRGRAGIWSMSRARDELAERALSALHLFHRDTHYIVAEQKIEIVDEFTGRVMPDRSWEFGLHQMIEAKEGMAITGQKVTLARITYQRFFRRYRHLGGMTGTAMEVADEVAGVYGLSVTRIPTNRRSGRRESGLHVFPHSSAKWPAIVRSARDCAGCGRAVLIGTRSVETSEHLSGLMTAAGVTHSVLNARHNRQEAELIAAAGQAGRVTIATNMAGRGTDIRLSREVRSAGGLHVILTEFHESKRIDRQLFGRGGRQGDPGTFECFAALNDDVFVRFSSPGRRYLAGLLAGQRDAALPANFARWLVRGVQTEAERMNWRIRKETLANDIRLDGVLAFSGQGE